MKRTLLSMAAMMLLWTGSHAQEWVEKMNDPNATFKEVQASFYKHWKNKPYQKGHGYKQFKRWEYLWGSRLDKDGNLPKQNFLIEEQERYRASHPQLKNSAAGNWSLVEPTNINELKHGLGRVQWVTAHPNNSNILWAGTPAGGLWKSTDAGQNWTTNTDNLPTMGVSGIVIDPNNTNIMYIATGDPDGSSNRGHGVLKSTDGGATWNTTGLSATILTEFNIYDLRLHPTNSQILFAATSTGIWKTTNAAANWTKVNPTVHTMDLEFHPTNPKIMYCASQKKVEKTTDGGATWTRITNGISTEQSLRTEIAVTPAKPDYVYIIDANMTGSGRKLYRSTDAGASFTIRNANMSVIGNQCSYDLCIAASPTNAEEVFVGGVNLMKSTNGGQNFIPSVAATQPNGGSLHVDHHNLIWIGNTLYSCNDGGLYKTTNSGAGWTLLGNGMDIMQFYSVSAYKYDVNFITAGSQDNGSSRIKDGVWKKINDADGMTTIISYDNPRIVYTSKQSGNGPEKSIDGGNTFQSVKGNINEKGAWVTPYIQDPKNPNTLYAGFQNVWKTTQGGGQWTKISNFSDINYIQHMAQSESNLNVIWVNKGNKLYKTENGGTNWTEVPITETRQRKSITIDPANSKRVWVALTGTDVGSKVYKTENGGTTWTNVSGSIPNFPISDIVYQKGSNDALYIATELGVYFKDNSMNDWIPFNNKLPNTRINDIEINYASGRLIAATYGRSIWSSPLHTNATKPIADFKALVINACKGGTVQYKNYSPNTTSFTWSFPGGTPSTSTAANPIVTYANGGTYSVTLTTSNANGSTTLTRSNYVNVSAGVINSFPYTENFDSFTVGNPGTMSNGWMNDTNDQGNWIVHKGKSSGKVQSSSGPGPNADHTSVNGHYLIAEFTKVKANNTANLYSPCLNLSGLTNPALEFYQHIHTNFVAPNSSPQFNVDLLVDGKWIENIVPAQSKPIGDHWVKQQFDLTPYAGKTVRVRFRSTFSLSAIDWAIDDFKVWNNPAAKPVSDFTATPRTGEGGMTVHFADNSSNTPASRVWTFPGGTPSTSTELYPVVKYNISGTHNVTLTTTNAQGSHTTTKTGYITTTGGDIMSNSTTTACTGTLYDSGGPRSGHAAGENFIFTIAPTNATSLTITTAEWNIGPDDEFIIYNGTSTSAPVIGTFKRDSNPGTKTASSGAMTIKFTSKPPAFYSGFKIDWVATGGSCGTQKPIAAFSANKTNPTAGDTVVFTDQSTNTPTSWAWSFPGGTPNTSTVKNPSIVYNTPGTYNVTLTATNAGGNNVLTKNSYITVKAKDVKHNMSNKTVTDCSGTLYDSGGASANYKNDENYTFVINPGNANSVTMNFSSWNVENSYDFLKIYNGTSASAPLIGSYSGTSPGTVVANSGAMTLVFTSDYTENRAGWQATWSCTQNTNPPVAAFTASATTVETGNTVSYADSSTNKPTSWLWTFEGGTPATSTAQNPTVTYNTAGVYKVTLKATNSFGSDDEVKETYITVKKPLTAYNMSSRTVTDCNGRLYDSGGKTGNYSDDENYTFVIQPSGASSITLTTHAWDVENSYDFLKIYNGTSASAPLLGSYSGTSPGTVTANSGAVTLVFTSDYTENKPGFDISWKTFGSGCRFASEAPPTTHAHATSNTTHKISNNDSHIKVYPIPATSTISVSLKQKPTKEAHIVVVDNLGRVVKQLTTIEATTHIDASILQAGIYLVKIIMNNETTVKRIIKK